MGRIGKPHGMRGEVVGRACAPTSPTAGSPPAAVLVRRPRARPPAASDALTVAATRWHQDRLLVPLRGARRPARRRGRRAGSCWRPTVDRRRAPRGPRGVLRPPAGRARGGHHRRATPVGTVAEVLHSGAQDLLVVDARRAATRAGAVRRRRSCPRSTSTPGGSSSPTDPGCSTPLDDGVTRRAHRRRLDLPRLPRAARAVAAGQGRRSAGCSTCTSTTCGDWTHDRHRTVDDTPYGGGAGMVMKPEPWGEALDALLAPTTAGAGARRADARAGRRSPRRLAAELAQERAPGVRLRPLRGHRPAGRRPRRDPGAGARGLASATTCSTGARSPRWPIIEAVVRLLPGFMGNAASLAEESHGAAGLLEYPVYTKPASLARARRPRRAALRRPRAGRAVAPRPVAAAVRRERRPDLLHPPPGRLDVRAASRRPSGAPPRAADAGELLTLQRACWIDEARGQRHVGRAGARTSRWSSVEADLERWTTFVLRSPGRLVGSVRAPAHWTARSGSSGG